MASLEMDLELANNIIENIKPMKKGTSISPHKFLMLLSIISLMEDNPKHENCFTFNELEHIFIIQFNKYFQSMPDNAKMLEYPFYHLQSEGFWFLKLKKGKEEKFKEYKALRLTKKRLLETIEYGYFDDNTFSILNKPEVRLHMKTEIIKRFNQNGKSNYEETNLTNGAMLLHEEQSLFKHEQSAIDVIRMAISNNKFGKITSNLLLYERQANNYLEFDIVLVTHWGIFAIELKHWSGHIKIAPYNWIINDFSYRNDPHQINSYKSKVLKGIYQHKFPSYPNVWVESVVILTNPEAVVDGSTSPKAAIEQNMVKKQNPSFASIQDFVSYLKKCSEIRNKILNEQEVENIANYLRMLNQPKRGLSYNIPGYETLEYISQKPDCIELIARSVESKVNGLNRFRIFRPPTNVSNEEKESFKKRAYNTVNLVSQIGDHPNILKVWVMKNDEGDIIEGSEWSETGTLRDLLINSDSTLDIENSMEICRSMTAALKTAHDVGIIHRSLRPENILMFNNIPKLINFDLAYQVEDNRITVISDANKLKDDGYIAPEILSGQDIDESTDFFNFGVITFELFTGQKPFASTKSFITQGGVLSQDALHRLRTSGAPEKIVGFIQQVIVADRRHRLNDISEIMKIFHFEDDTQDQGIVSFENQELKPYDQYELYEIIEKVGEGGQAQIYKAKTHQFNPNSGEDEEKIVALKIFNKEVSRDRILREYGINSAIQSAYTVRCEKLGYKKNDRYFFVMDYLEGTTLRQQIDNNTRPKYQTFLKVTHGLMDAVKALHCYKIDEETPKPYLHSDIKPDNIMILNDGKPVLIDFGIAGEPRIDSFQGTSEYVPPDSILGVDMKFSEDADLFALSVTLWEWLFGSNPYSNPTIGVKPEFPQETPFELPKYIKEWLLKAVATEAHARFKSILEMDEAFIPPSGDSKKPIEKVEDIHAETDKDPVHEIVAVIDDAISICETQNEFVNYLNTLSNISAGNENATAESQELNEYYDRISVQSSLTDHLINLLISEKRNVILTGNAGDGKTTIAAQIRERLVEDRTPLSPIEALSKVNLIIVKDMSELSVKDRTDILMQSYTDSVNTYLIVSNSGTLLDSFNELQKDSKLDIDQSSILKALSDDKHSKLLDGKFIIINIGSINSIKTVCEVFQRMIAESNWKKCFECSLKNDCPTYINVTLLQAKKEIVVDRVALIYRRLYEYNIRLTMRQMVGHLAFTLTAGLNCAEIASMSMIELRKNISKHLFFNLFFGDDGKELFPVAMQLLPVRHLREAGFGLFLDPLYERAIWARNEFNALHEEGINKEMTGKLSYLFEQVSSTARRQIRRLLYFYGLMESEIGQQFISVFLLSPMLGKYIDFTSKLKKIPAIEEKKLRMQILQVFQEFITGVRLPEGKWQAQEDYLYITLNRTGFSSGTQIVLANLHLSDFTLKAKTKYKVAEEKNSVLTLCYKNSDVSLELDLPFLDFVSRRYMGEVAEELSPNYTDRLNKFKVKLLSVIDQSIDDNHMKLLNVGFDRTFEVVNLNFVENGLEAIL